jgi:hypothetical protein
MMAETTHLGIPHRFAARNLNAKKIDLFILHAQRSPRPTRRRWGLGQIANKSLSAWVGHFRERGVFDVGNGF